MSMICLVDKLKIDKSIKEKELSHFGINKNPNFLKTNNLVGAASLHISLIRFPKDKFHNKTNLSFDKVKIKSEGDSGCVIDTIVPLWASKVYNGNISVFIFLNLCNLKTLLK